MRRTTFVLSACLSLLAACTMNYAADPGEDDDQPALPACEPSGAEICDNDVDDDCDGEADCDDDVCASRAQCLGCGSLDVTEGQPLALPDGEGGSYESTIDFTGFTDGQVLGDAGEILGVCVNMEHSWLRDLQIDLTCPTGQRVVLQQFLGRTGGEVYMGQPDDTDTLTPVPGTGAEYCWSIGAINPPMLDYANQHIGVRDLPPGDYQANESFDALVGCSLNGDWTIKVTDLWAIDNGFIFSWGINFDPGIVEDCDDWQVE